jgi:predicted DCC family thiol-disulfide oxidoreductase YuxK
MRETWDRDGVWFLYDGECPMCSSVAQALRIKQEYGSIHLLDARTSGGDPLFMEATRRGMDLDEGVLIAADGRLFQGLDAVKFMARFGEVSNPLTAVVRGVMWSDWVSGVIYPWMKSVRNMLLKRRDVARIDNLELKREPIFKPIFGTAWDDLPEVFHLHYANRPYTSDRTRVVGVMDVACSGPMKLLAPLVNLLGQIPARNESDVSVAVEYRSDIYTKAFGFTRMFGFEGREPYIFQSRMIPIDGGDVVEVMRFGLCWQLRFDWDGGKVTLNHRGYALSLFGHFLPLPLTWVLGTAYCEETVVDDRTFDMVTDITHPLWGRVYEYKGRFRVVEVAGDRDAEG